MVRLGIYLLALLLPVLAATQEVLLPLQSLSVQPVPKTAGAAMPLPFFDDFSTGGQYPSPTLWQASGATVETGDRLLPPTVGVATLDAIDAQGRLYPLASSSLFPADTLTSRAVRLHEAVVADSVVFSFYFFPGGGHGNPWELTGETPDGQDSLFLDFYRPADSMWVNVWSRGGTQGAEWQYVALMLDDEAWFDSTFRFRFRNYASLETSAKPGLTGNCDMWHLDYVRLDRGRTASSVPAFRDVAFVTPAPSLLKHYRAMPARQYRPDEMAESQSMTITNLYSSDLATHYGYVVVGQDGDTVYRYDGGYENAPPHLPQGSYQTSPLHASPLVGYAFPEMNAPRIYSVVHVVREGNAPDNYPCNDTVHYRQVFADYYAYDDGSAENGYGLTSTASHLYLAYRFDLNQADTLTALDLYFNRTKDGENEQVPFRITVWQCAEDGKPGQELYSDTEVRYPQFEGMNTYQRYILETPLVIEGCIFVGFEQENNRYINLGFDRSFNTAERIYYRTGMEWQQSILNGSLMLRPCFGVAATVGLPESADRPQARLYPNPASDEVWVDGVEERCRVELYNMLGHRVGWREGSGRLATASLPAGVYVLRVETPRRGEVSVYKLIISR